MARKKATGEKDQSKLFEEQAAPPTPPPPADAGPKQQTSDKQAVIAPPVEEELAPQTPASPVHALPQNEEPLADDLGANPVELLVPEKRIRRGLVTPSEEVASQLAPKHDRTSSPAPPRPVPDRKLYQDEIYGTKELSPLAVALIDTPEFQRLSHIFQLGFTYQVFRGANHRRFDHSVGTYFMVRTLMRRVVQNHTRFYRTNPDVFKHPGLYLSPRMYLEAPATPGHGQTLFSPMGRWRGVTEVVSAAALLHDLGHVPVGHTLEDEFSVLGKHDSLGGSRLFEMLYGPRQAKRDSSLRAGQPRVHDYFGSGLTLC